MASELWGSVQLELLVESGFKSKVATKTHVLVYYAERKINELVAGPYVLVEWCTRHTLRQAILKQREPHHTMVQLVRELPRSWRSTVMCGLPRHVHICLADVLLPSAGGDPLTVGIVSLGVAAEAAQAEKLG